MDSNLIKKVIHLVVLSHHYVIYLSILSCYPGYGVWNQYVREIFFSVLTVKVNVSVYYYYLALYEFFIPALAGGLSLESKWKQVSSGFRTFLSILADLDNTVLWIFSNLLLISNFSILFFQTFWIVPSAPVILSINVTLLLHSLKKKI